MRYLHLPSCSLRCQPALAQCHKVVLQVPTIRSSCCSRETAPGAQEPRLGAWCVVLTAGTALSMPPPCWAGQPGGCFQGGCSEGDHGRAGGAPAMAMCEGLLGMRVSRGPFLLFCLLMLSSGRELEHAGKSFLHLLCLRLQPLPRSLPPSFIYGTATSFQREVASITKWQKGLNENKVFA